METKKINEAEERNIHALRNMERIKKQDNIKYVISRKEMKRSEKNTVQKVIEKKIEFSEEQINKLKYLGET
jgi:hypothetical protein